MLPVRFQILKSKNFNGHHLVGIFLKKWKVYIWTDKVKKGNIGVAVVLLLEFMHNLKAQVTSVACVQIVVPYNFA